MARIINKGTTLEDELNYYQKRIRKKTFIAMFLSIIGVVIALFFQTTLLLFFSIILSILFLLCISFAIGLAVSIRSERNKIDILWAGIEGENKTSKWIILLPESYTAFRNITVSYQSKQSEIDLLVIGPAGVFVIETKNLNGSIYGNISDKYWTLYKVGRAGTPYLKSFYSPVKQVNTHVYRVVNYLRENGIYIHIDPVVYFSNIATSSHISAAESTTPIFFAKDDGTNKMLHYILNNKQRLSQNECNKIINLFKNT